MLRCQVHRAGQRLSLPLPGVLLNFLASINLPANKAHCTGAVDSRLASCVPTSNQSDAAAWAASAGSRASSAAGPACTPAAGQAQEPRGACGGGSSSAAQWRRQRCCAVTSAVLYKIAYGLEHCLAVCWRPPPPADSRLPTRCRPRCPAGPTLWQAKRRLLQSIEGTERGGEASKLARAEVEEAQVRRRQQRSRARSHRSE